LSKALTGYTNWTGCAGWRMKGQSAKKANSEKKKKKVGRSGGWEYRRANKKEHWR